MSEYTGKVVKELHADYEFFSPNPAITDETAKRFIGAKPRKVDGVWGFDRRVQYAIEFTDGSILTFDSCGCCDGIEMERL